MTSGITALGLGLTVSRDRWLRDAVTNASPAAISNSRARRILPPPFGAWRKSFTIVQPFPRAIRQIGRSFGIPNGTHYPRWDTQMSSRTEVWQGTLALMVLKTLAAMGPQHGYGIARRIEQTSDDMLSINEGTLYPLLLRLEQEGAIASQWGTSENNRRARFYRITRRGQKLLATEVSQWTQANDIVARFIALKGMKP